jgi:hypothetical protein
MRKIAGFVMVAALSSAALGGVALTVATAAPAGHTSSSVVIADGGDTTPANPAPTPSPTDTHSNPTTWGWG